MLKKIWSVVSNVLVGAVVLLALLLAGARLLGLQVYTVLSGSMEPNYHVGAIIYVRETDPAELEVGDPITFVISENTVATHRIIEVVPDENDPDVIRFRTKGDANDTEDNNLVHCNNVLGRVVGTIPYLGYVSDFVQNPPGTYITLGAVALMILIVFVPDMIGPFLKKSEPEEEEPAAIEHDTEKIRAEVEELKERLRRQMEEKEKNQDKTEDEKHENC